MSLREILSIDLRKLELKSGNSLLNEIPTKDERSFDVVGVRKSNALLSVGVVLVVVAVMRVTMGGHMAESKFSMIFCFYLYFKKEKSFP